MILAEWQEYAQIASVHHHRAECLAGLGDREAAVAAYRDVFTTQRDRKGERTDAHLDFGWLVATTPLPQLYDEALALLDQFGDGPFPVQQYRAAAIRALIHAVRGESKKAQRWARSALDAASAQSSGFPYHVTVGLVESPEKGVHETLQSLAG